MNALKSWNKSINWLVNWQNFNCTENMNNKTLLYLTFKFPVHGSVILERPSPIIGTTEQAAAPASVSHVLAYWGSLGSVLLLLFAEAPGTFQFFPLYSLKLKHISGAKQAASQPQLPCAAFFVVCWARMSTGRPHTTDCGSICYCSESTVAEHWNGGVFFILFF